MLSPAFIYSYVPLTEEQTHAENILPFSIAKDGVKSIDEFLANGGFKYDDDELEELKNDQLQKYQEVPEE